MSRRSALTARAAVVAGVVALGAAAAGITAAAAAPSHQGARPDRTAKPTIVLVHGAWADSSGWNDEITRLTHLGYPVLTESTPLRGLTSDADHLRARLQTISGPIVLVGHSYGGAVITNAARGVPNVKALVYAAAFVPAANESLQMILAEHPGSHIDGTKLDVVPVANAAADGGQDADLYIKPADFRDIFAGDVSAQRSALEAATQRPLANTAFAQLSGAPAYADVPSWDLISLDDHAIPASAQLFMARRAGAHLESIHSAHDIMISHPTAVEHLIIEAANAVS
ncbi:alpha/beta hydrolase [Rugosimonospora acidiphila]|uniref:Alpha/beta hydrolase n=1 Tax=Rugosimonospora acidiphila TaxID=556531 RepID=A0ABP9SL60_9ACTN